MLIAILLLANATAAARAADGIYICAEHTDHDDWEDEFSRGPVVVPSGTVFDYAGHLMGGNLQDAKDWAHSGDAGKWKGISKQEEQRRSDLLAQDVAIDQKNTSAVVTTKPVTLTRSVPCALTTGEAVLSKQWGWTVSPPTGDGTLYYQTYGVIRRGALDTNFDADNIPLNHLAARGQLNASVRGTLTKTMNLDELSAKQPPDNSPVTGKGNTECWGDDTRQDISCRALTEDFLLSMRGATKDEVIKAMNVGGREITSGLHFISNYSKGERWGSGDANFTFDAEGRVSVIAASIDPPGMAGKHADFIWNAFASPSLGDEIDRSTKNFKREPVCSDFSGKPAKCKDDDSIDHQLTLFQMQGSLTKSELLKALEVSCNLGQGLNVSDPAGDCARLRKRLR